jgi:hypothetical protein
LKEEFLQALLPTLCMNTPFRRGARTMQSDKVIIVFITAGWAVLSGIMATAITSAPWTPPTLLFQTVFFFTPLLLRPLSGLMRLFRRPIFILIKKRRRTWLHLNPWLSTGHLGLQHHRLFWQALTGTLRLTINQSSLPVVMSSHLLGPNRIARLRRHFSAGYYLFHVIKRPVGPAERIGLQVDTFLKEWRWFTPSAYGAVVIIRMRKNKAYG